MTAPKWTRPTPSPTAHIWERARLAISDAQHAGDPAYAARVLSEAAWACVRYERLWTEVRPPLGRPRSTATQPTPSGQREEAA